MNKYKEILAACLPRVWAQYDIDPCSQRKGYGDRSFWAWKTKDFSNATLQGGVHALAAAVELDLVDNPDRVIQFIHTFVMALPDMAEKNGSLCEAYPLEHSFCVTALGAFDALSAARILKSRLPAGMLDKWLDAVAPLMQFIMENDEEHAIISNHLATAAAACSLWNYFTEKGADRADELLQCILKHQSLEGWYLEYEGPDPGYQTLCTYYLFSLYQTTGNKELLVSLEKSATFLKHFVHPDGTIGGLYGSRNTEVYYPGGVVGLAAIIPDFATVAKAMVLGVENGANLLPLDIDSGNFVPLLNSYATAALYVNEFQDVESPPWQKQGEIHFSDAGISLYSTARYYAVVNYKKGGTLKVFDKVERILDVEDGGIFGRLEDGRKFSSQAWDDSSLLADSKVHAQFHLVDESMPSILTTIILRLLALTLFRHRKLGEVFKRFVVRKLMTGKKKISGGVKLRFEFMADRINVYENIVPPKKTKNIGRFGKCKAIHMASSGYLLKQDLQKPTQSVLVTYITEDMA